MDGNTSEDVWKTRDARAAEFIPHDKWSQRIVDISNPSSIKKPSDICEAVWFLFGPAFSIQNKATNVFSEWVETTLGRFARAGVFPRHRHAHGAFALVTLPMCTANEAFIEPGMEQAHVACRPHWVGESTVREREEALNSSIWALVHMGADTKYIEEVLFTVPGLNAAMAFYDTKLWRFVRQIADSIEKVSTDNPLIDGFFFATLDASNRQDNRPEYITTINAVYGKMTPAQYAKVMTRTESDHVFVHPPAHMMSRIAPSMIPERIVIERRRWLEATYGLFVDHYIVYTLNFAHMLYLSQFFPAYSTNMPRKFRRARAKVLDIFMSRYEQRIRKNVLADLYTDLASPSLAYTHPVCIEEVQSWLLHAFEFEYVQQLSRVRKAGSSAALCRAYSENAMTMDDIVETLSVHNITLTEEWIDNVFDNWGSLHGEDYQLDSTHGPSSDASHSWMMLFKKRMNDRQLIGTVRSSATIAHHLADVLHICVARFMCYSFYETRAGVLSTAEASEMSNAYTECRLESRYLHRVHAQHTTSVRVYDNLSRFFRKIMFPCINRCANPARLFQMVDGVFLKYNFPDDNTTIVPPVYWGRDGIMRDDIFIEHASPAEKNTFPWYGVNSSKDITRLLLFAVHQYRASVTSYNWHERFYEQWAIPNKSTVVGGISYAARLDNLELDAHNINLLARGYIHTTNVKYTVAEFTRTIMHVAVTDWPCYMRWCDVNVTWRAHVQGDTDPSHVFEYSYAVQGRIFYPVEMACAIILSKLRHERDLVDRRVADIVITCTVEGTYRISKRVPSAEAKLRVRASCIVTIPNF